MIREYYVNQYQFGDDDSFYGLIETDLFRLLEAAGLPGYVQTWHCTYKGELLRPYVSGVSRNRLEPGSDIDSELPHSMFEVQQLLHTTRKS